MAENQPENFDVPTFESIQARQPPAHLTATPALVQNKAPDTHWLRAEPKAHHLSPSARPHTGHMCGT